MQISTNISAVTILTVLLAFYAPTVVNAEALVDTAPGVCIEPQRPENDQDDVLWQKFLGDIELFRGCVNQTVEWHQAQAERHSVLARQAADRWNQFVQAKLNAPEDFPHPAHSKRKN